LGYARLFAAMRRFLSTAKTLDWPQGDFQVFRKSIGFPQKSGVVAGKELPFENDSQIIVLIDCQLYYLSI